MRTIRSVVLSITLLVAVSPVSEAQGPFPVTSTAGQVDWSGGVAFDGVNFLVAIQGDTAGVGPTPEVAQLVDSSGALIGPLIQTGRTGGLCAVAFGGGTYLLAWDDDALFPYEDIWGAFISPAGVLGAPFQINSTPSVNDDNSGVASDGANFLVVWLAGNTPTTRQVVGQFVSPTAGLVGSVFTISSGYGSNESIVFGGGQYLVAWTEDSLDTDVRARFVSPSGTLGPEFSVNVDPTLLVGDGLGTAVSYAGPDFLVVWTREKNSVPGGEFDVYGQLVSPPNTKVGSAIPVCTSGNAQEFPSVAFDGSNYLVTWTDTLNDIDQDFECDGDESTCIDINGQFISPAGALVGPIFSVVSDAGLQYLSRLAWGGSKFLVAWTDGDSPGNPGALGDVYGRFVDPSAIQLPAVYCTSKVNSLGCTPLVTWSGVPSLSSAQPFDIGALNVLSQKNGLAFWGGGSASLPFQGSTLCVLPPTSRTALQYSFGSPGTCTGFFSLDFNAVIQAGSPFLVLGSLISVQYWYRDPGDPFGVGLTNAVQFTIGP